MHWRLGSPTAFGGAYTGALWAFWQRIFWALQQDLPRARVLDLGTGNYAIPRIARTISAAFELHALDRVAPHPAMTPPGVQFRLASAHATGYQNGYFDAVVGNFALEYTAEILPQALAEIHRILRPGGRAAFVLHHRDSVAVRDAKRYLKQRVLPRIAEALERVAHEFQNTPGAFPRRAFDKAMRDLEVLAAEVPDDEFAADAPRMLQQIEQQPTPDAMRALLERRQTEVRFYRQRDEELLRVAIPADAHRFLEQLVAHAFVVDAWEPLYDDGQLIGWTLQMHTPAAGLEEAVEAWADMSVTPARETSKRLFPIFYASETFSAIPLVAKAGLPFVAVVSSGLEEARVRALLNGLGIHPENYWIRQAGPAGDRAARLPAIREEFAGQYDVVLVEPGAAWLQTLLAGLEEIGVLPLGGLDRALELTEQYFARLA